MKIQLCMHVVICTTDVTMCLWNYCIILYELYHFAAWNHRINYVIMSSLNLCNQLSLCVPRARSLTGSNPFTKEVNKCHHSATIDYSTTLKMSIASI